MMGKNTKIFVLNKVLASINKKLYLCTEQI